MKTQKPSKDWLERFDVVKFKSPPPTILELSQIMATLTGKSLEQDDSKLARKAFQIWEACDQELMSERIHKLIYDGYCKLVSRGIAGVLGEAPESWPCSFNDALRRIMPKKRTQGDRHGLFRLFLKELIHAATPAKQHSTESNDLQCEPPSEQLQLDEIERAFKSFKPCGFRDWKEYQEWLEPFSTWLTIHEAEMVSNQRSTAAKARWGKRLTKEDEKNT
jgi:hypothetical protein